MQRFIYWWDRLTHPFEPIAEQTTIQQQQLHLQISLFLFMGIASFIEFGIRMLAMPNIPVTVYTIIIPFNYFFFYGLSRTRYHQFAARAFFLVCVILIAVIYIYVELVVPERLLYRFVFLLLLGGILLTVKEFLILWLSFSSMAVVLPYLKAYPRYSTLDTLIFVTLAAMLVLVSTLLRRYYRDELEHSEMRHRELMEAGTEALLIVDAKTNRIIDLNKAFERLVGVEFRQVIGTEPTDYLAPDEVDHARRAWQARQHSTHKFHILHASKQPIPVEARGKPYLYQNRAAYVISLQDITAQAQAERDRIENERRYNALIDRTTDAVFLISIDGMILHANKQAAEMLRCELKEIVGTHISEFLVDDERLASQERIEQLLRGDRLPAWERQMQRANGESVLVEISAVLVRDTSGRPAYFQSLVRDISERRKAEKQRFELALQRERTAMLQRFIDEASHHFRTPITNMKTSTYLLPRLLDHPQKRDHYLTVLSDELERLQKLVDDLLMVARLEQDTDAYRIHPVALHTIVDRVRTQVQAYSAYLRYEWDWSSIDRSGQVLADEQRLNHAVMNLLDNAMRYTPPRGKIRVSAFVRSPWGVIEIKDNGIGISREDLPYIFDDFYRSDTARERDNTRTGLGLSISSKIIELHQGGLRVSSEVERGSTFQIILPLRSVAPVEVALPDELLLPLSDSESTSTR